MEEDQSKWTCTLFKPIQEDGHFKLLHVQSRTHLSLNTSNEDYRNCLYTESEESGNNYDRFKVIDWDAMVILPRHVVFKGDNDMYLTAVSMVDKNFLSFIIEKNDGSEPNVMNEVSYARDGSIRIRSICLDRYWTRCEWLSPGLFPEAGVWIVAESEDSAGGDLDTVFWLARVPGRVNTITLWNSGNLRCCKRGWSELEPLCLSPSGTGHEGEARIRFEECVKSREIQGIKYHVKDVRFYNDTIARGDTLHVRNEDPDPQNPDIVSFTYKLTKSRSSSWMSSNTIKVGLKITIGGQIAFIAKDGVEFSVEYTHVSESSQIEESSEEVDITDTVKVPAGYEIAIVGLVKQASAYIPFSYTQIDTLYDDTQVITEMHDGVYHVENGYDYDITKSKPQKIDD